MTLEQPRRPKGWILSFIILTAGAIPLLSYWYWIERGPGLSPQQAWDMLSKPDSSAILVDVRTPQEYAAGHIDGAVSWPYEEIMTWPRGRELPRPYAEKKLILICTAGVSNALAARRLRDDMAADSSFVIGGMQAWIGHADQPCGLAVLRRQNSPATTRLPSRPSSVFEQWALIASGFVVKPIYQILALILIIVLWRASMPDLIALKWSMVFFLSGELACMLNYLLFAHESYFIEYLHGFGMVVGFGYAMYAFFEGMDARVIHLSDPVKKCAALNLCQSCVKYADVSCGLKRIFYFVIPASLLLALLPFFASFTSVSYNTQVFGKFYNFSHAVLYQIYEIRICPALAAILFIASLVVLLYRNNDAIEWAKILYAAGFGALGFGLLRLILVSLFKDDQVWFNFWEEITEFLFVAGVCFTLWLFRGTLFSAPPKT